MAMANISPSAFCLVQGSPATWYSSVRRGSNILRNSTLPECPPVATMTPRRAWILTFLPPKLAVIPCTLPEVGLSRLMLVIFVAQEESHTFRPGAGLEVADET
jgi:hypothetical protein